jgi:hypothetical protein
MLYDTLMEIGRENNINNKHFEQKKRIFWWSKKLWWNTWVKKWKS